MEQERKWSVAWCDTAPIPLPAGVQRLGDVLAVRGTPLAETAPSDERHRYQVYQTMTSVGEVAVTVSVNGWHVFFLPWGTRRFMNIWDWKERALGEPRPKGRELPLGESVEWVLGLLEKNRRPEVDLECVERAGRELDRHLVRERWLWPLLMVVSGLAVLGLLVGSAIFRSMSGMVIGSLALVRMAPVLVEIIGRKLSRSKK